MFHNLRWRVVITFAVLMIACMGGLSIYIHESLGYLTRGIVIADAITAIIAVLLAAYLSKTIAEPVKKLTEMSRRIAQGQLNPKIQVSSRDEFGDLAMALSQVSAKLGEMEGLVTAERDRISAILSSMPDGIFLVGSEGKVIMANQAAERMFPSPFESEGFADTALGHTFIEMVHDHELDSILQKCLKTGEQQTGLVEVDSGKRLLRVVATPISGSCSCALLLQDLTEVRRVEKMRRDFIANVSHELRTPVASLKALSETLQEGAIDDPAVAKDFLERISAETDRLAQMVNELGELSRIESGEVSFKIEPVDIVELVKWVVERLRAQADRARVSLVVDIPSDLPEALADNEGIEQVLVNLLHNAIKFTPPGGQINVTAKVEANDIQVSVADTGVGIPADDLSHIFERFYKADKARAGGGTGLGLAIARHIIEAHGGRIWAESVEGQGSTFTFTIPVAPKA